MRGPLTYEDIQEREDAAEGLDPDLHREAAADLLAWAGEPHPDDAPDVNRAELLVSAAAQLSLAGDFEPALGVLREAVATGEPVDPDVRAYLIHGLLKCGLAEEADKVAADLRRERPANLLVHHLVGVAYEEADRLDLALRWFTMGATRAVRMEDTVLEGWSDDVDDVGAGFDAIILMTARFRVRRKMGFPLDGYDEVAADVLEAAEQL